MDSISRSCQTLAAGHMLILRSPSGQILTDHPKRRVTNLCFCAPCAAGGRGAAAAQLDPKRCEFGQPFRPRQSPSPASYGVCAQPADMALPLPPQRPLSELFGVLAATLQLAGSGAHSATWDWCAVLYTLHSSSCCQVSFWIWSTGTVLCDCVDLAVKCWKPQKSNHICSGHASSCDMGWKSVVPCSMPPVLVVPQYNLLL